MNEPPNPPAKHLPSPAKLLLSLFATQYGHAAIGLDPVSTLVTQDRYAQAKIAEQAWARVQNWDGPVPKELHDALMHGKDNDRNAPDQIRVGMYATARGHSAKIVSLSMIVATQHTEATLNDLINQLSAFIQKLEILEEGALDDDRE